MELKEVKVEVVDSEEPCSKPEDKHWESTQNDNKVSKAITEIPILIAYLYNRGVTMILRAVIALRFHCR
jgi:hypothetical protein